MDPLFELPYEGSAQHSKNKHAMSLKPLPISLIPFLAPYLPEERVDRPFVTLTWAQSLDSRIAAAPGTQTKISNPETKTMTHYLRAYHDAIFVGVGTVLADDPKLTCRYGNFSKIRPIVLDPHGKWIYSKSTIAKLCLNTTALAPYIFIDKRSTPSKEEKELLQSQGGFYKAVELSEDYSANWEIVLREIYACGISSVMVEGGAKVINSLLLQKKFVDSVIITIGPVFLGSNGVEVAPSSLAGLEDVSWWKGERDSVMAARLVLLPANVDGEENEELSLAAKP